MHFPSEHKIWNTLRKKMRIRSYLFQKLLTAKSGINEMTKKSRMRTLQDSQHVKGSETLHKSARQYFSHIS